MQSPSRSWASLFLRGGLVVFVLILALGAAVILVKTGPKAQRQLPEIQPPAVRVLTLAPEEVTLDLDAFGTLKPRRRVRIIAEVSGRVISLHPRFKAGGSIPQGNPIIQLDDRTHALDLRTARVRVDQARIDIRNLAQETENLKADMALARANLDLAQKELDRMKTLNQKDFASRNSLDRAEQQQLSAKIQLRNLENRMNLIPIAMDQRKTALNMARIAEDLAALNLSKTEISVDFDAWVLEKNVELGEFVNPGATLGDIYEKGALDLEVAVPLEQLAWLGRFDRPDQLSARVGPAAEGSLEYSARVVRVGAAVDEATRTLPMTLEILPAPELAPLKPGTFVNCRIQGVRTARVYRLSRHLVHTDQTVFLFEDGQLKIQPVHVLRTRGDMAWVDQGLKAGDILVTSPLPGAVDGMALTRMPTADGEGT